jgi:hypothetical protein
MNVPYGVLIRAETISSDGESQGQGEYVVTLEENTIDIRLHDDDDTIAMLNLEEVEEAIKTLKRWVRSG